MSVQVQDTRARGLRLPIRSLALLLGWGVILAPALAAAAAAPQKLVPSSVKATATAVQSTPLVYTNNATITIPGAPGATSGVASPYPSTITVPAGDSRDFITDIRVKLNGLSHTYPSDLSLLLVDPNGNKYVLMSYTGGGDDLNTAFITLDDHAAVGLPRHLPIGSGSYKPRDYRVSDSFPAPAPAGPYDSGGVNGTKSLYQTFNGNGPGDNGGVWSLYVVDQATGDTGQISGGWSLIFTVEHQFSSFPTSITINDSASPPTKATPYPSTITVSGMGHKLKEIGLSFYGFSHTFPDDVDMLLVAPNGRAFIVMSDAGGTTPQSPVVFELTDRAGGSLSSTSIPSFEQFRATNYFTGDTFPSPAPAPPYGNSFASGSNAGSEAMSSYFDGIDPNGDWQLYVVDDAGGDSGSITQWALNLTSYPEYDNGSAITLNDGAKAAPYPSQIIVQNVAGTRTGAYVRFNGFSHSAPADVDALLANSNGGSFVFQADAGGTGGVSGVTYTIDDSGASALPAATGFVDGSVYRPADFAAPAFPAPAPAGNTFAPPMGGGTFRSAFLGGSPNGAWNLYLNGGASGGSGTIASGWTLGVTYAFDPIFVDNLEDTDSP